MSSLSRSSATPSTASRDQLPQRLAEALDTFGPAYIRWLQAGTRASGTTHARLRLLDVLHCDGPQPMGRIGERLGVTPRNVTALVDGLEEEGLVRRVAHPTDRRATLVEVTDAGQAVGPAAFASQRERASELLATLPREDQETFLRILERLIGELRARR